MRRGGNWLAGFIQTVKYARVLAFALFSVRPSAGRFNQNSSELLACGFFGAVEGPNELLFLWKRFKIRRFFSHLCELTKIDSVIILFKALSPLNIYVNQAQNFY
jgi:hypothetical protein